MSIKVLHILVKYLVVFSRLLLIHFLELAHVISQTLARAGNNNVMGWHVSNIPGERFVWHRVKSTRAVWSHWLEEDNVISSNSILAKKKCCKEWPSSERHLLYKKMKRLKTTVILFESLKLSKRINMLPYRIMKQLKQIFLVKICACIARKQTLERSEQTKTKSSTDISRHHIKKAIYATNNIPIHYTALRTSEQLRNRNTWKWNKHIFNFIAQVSFIHSPRNFFWLIYLIIHLISLPVLLLSFSFITTLNIFMMSA